MNTPFGFGAKFHHLRWFAKKILGDLSSSSIVFSLSFLSSFNARASKMELLSVFVLFVILLYLLNKYILSYWSRNGFKQLEPKFIFGDAIKLLTLKQSIADYFKDIYNKHKTHGIIGIYVSYLPTLVINDPLIIQNIMVKDFSNFRDRPMPVDESIDPLSGEWSLNKCKWRQSVQKCFVRSLVQSWRSKVAWFENKTIANLHFWQAQGKNYYDSRRINYLNYCEIIIFSSTGHVPDHQKLWSRPWRFLGEKC